MSEGGVFDAIVIGGGPTGSIAAREMAKAGLHVLLLERSAFPRFHVGESLLPYTHAQLQRLGLGAALSALPQVPKIGATFVMGHGRDEPSDYWFGDWFGGVDPVAMNLERAPFDAMLLDEARAAGADIRTGTKVVEVSCLKDGKVEIRSSDGTFAGRYLVDASGSATVLGRHLGARTVLADLRKVAYYGHFTGVARPEGDPGGFPRVVMCDEAWFWLIPVDADRTSIGLVADESFIRSVDVPPSAMLSWAIERCPMMQRWCVGASPCVLESGGDADKNRVEADFSYVCRPYAGPGYFLCGDAATFVDPVFSSGVCLGMAAGESAAVAIRDILAHSVSPAKARKRYCRSVDRSSAALFKLVRMFYRHEFRELFLHGVGPLAVHRAVLAVLSGNVFPRPSFALRWRLALFSLFGAIQRHRPLAPRRDGFSLTSGDYCSVDGVAGSLEAVS